MNYFFKKSKKKKSKNPYLLYTHIEEPLIIEQGKKYSDNDVLDLAQTSKRSGTYIGKALNKSNISFFYFVIIFGLFTLITKSFYLQVVEGKEYYSLAEKNRIQVTTDKAARGLIYDRNGVILVKNIPNFTLSITPSELPVNQAERNEVLQQVSLIAGIARTELDDILETIPSSTLEYYRKHIIKDNIAYEYAVLLSIESSQLPGVDIATDTSRQYLYPDESLVSLSHILGYVGKISEQEILALKEKGYGLTDYVGKTGIEYFYENELRGQDGYLQVEVDAYGREKKVLFQQEKVRGNDVVLTIDAQLQAKVTEILQDHLDKNKKKRGTVIALDPRNGEIKAMVSLPTFNNNDFAQGISTEIYQQLIEDEDKPLFFRSINGEYPSGSTFKMIVGAAALQEGIITKSTRILSTGGLRIGQWFFPDWRAGGHGSTNIYKALSDSVNTFFYMIGGGYDDFDGLGVVKIAFYAKEFGLGEKLGIDLSHEKPGFVPTPEWKEETKNEQWYIGDTYHFAIGQGDLLVTPLQVAHYTATIANGGYRYRPHLLKQIISSKDNQINDVQPQLISQVPVDKENIEAIQDGLRQTVTEGSGRRLNYIPLDIAGKTGTAQWHSEKDPHAWFTSYAPFENPDIVITVLVEEGEEGSGISVQIAEDIYNYINDVKNKGLFDDNTLEYDFIVNPNTFDNQVDPL